MPIENNPRKIPQLTSIPTPTAGQELDIETVVAKESTYANFKMTLAQIFTLATISGSIKTVTDNLASLISGNANSINTLTSTKLNTAGGTRTGLTENRVIITDSSGGETYLTGTTTQVIGFDGAGKPVAVTPTVDINGLTEKTAVGVTDMIIMYDSTSGTNKKHLTKASVTNEGIVRLATDSEAISGVEQEKYINSKQLKAKFDFGYKTEYFSHGDIRGSLGTPPSAGNTQFGYLLNQSGLTAIEATTHYKYTGGTISSIVLNTYTINGGSTVKLFVKINVFRAGTELTANSGSVLYAAGSGPTGGFSIPVNPPSLSLLPGDVYMITVQRDGDGAGDNANSIYVHGITVTYT